MTSPDATGSVPPLARRVVPASPRSGRGAVFVDEVDQVPSGAPVVFSAHGVAPEVHRQAAVRALTDDTQLVLVLGSANSANSRHLVELAERLGVPAHLTVEDVHFSPAAIGDPR